MEEINKMFAAFGLSAEEIRSKLTSMGLSSEEIRSKFASMGLSPEEINKKLASMGVPLDEVTQKVASLGLPGVILVITVALSQATSYPIAVALAILGGPLGILGGLGVLGLASVLGDVLTGYGFDAVLIAVYKERRKKESQESLLKEVEGLPITEDLKLKLKHQIEVEIVSEDIGYPRTVEIVDEE